MQPNTSPRRRLASQHLLIYELYRHGETVFDGITNFRTWLERPNTALSGKRPIDLLTSARGFKEVDDLLTRIEFGVY
ncbi:antitoxin Xre/MbcA/ParS toxin-binding domain-containing protein [Spirosoma arcticum]